ncbi:MAG: hypothetical protein L0H29_08240 [Sinobacteraceae bacterium]|nr:hypothetical protein [Nevskiaceae bacterium]
MTGTTSPSEALSTEVVDRLIEVGLLRGDKRDALIAKIASGKMKGEDWKLEIDLADAKAKAAQE